MMITRPPSTSPFQSTMSKSKNLPDRKTSLKLTSRFRQSAGPDISSACGKAVCIWWANPPCQVVSNKVFNNFQTVSSVRHSYPALVPRGPRPVEQRAPSVERFLGGSGVKRKSFFGFLSLFLQPPAMIRRNPGLSAPMP